MDTPPSQPPSSPPDKHEAGKSSLFPPSQPAQGASQSPPETHPPSPEARPPSAQPPSASGPPGSYPPDKTPPPEPTPIPRQFRRLQPVPRPPKPRNRLLTGTIYQLGVVLAAAIIVATLFTAWTPGGYPTEFTPPESTLVAAVPTQVIPGLATATPRGPLHIGIVAGHWKNDSGAVCPDGLTEVEVNQTIATLVQKDLVEKGYQVDLLSEFDEQLAGYKAAALVSIHNDSCQFINNEATGFKVAASFATKNKERAARLTACIRSRYGQATGLPVHSTSVTPDMTSYHSFNEIDEGTPAAIIETGFLNLDRALLTQHPDLVAQGIVNGIECYLKNESITPPTLAPAPSPTQAP